MDNIVHELVDVHKANLQKEEEDGDVRFVDKVHEMQANKNLKHLGMVIRILDNQGVCSALFIAC